MQGLDETKIVELDNTTRQKVDATIDALEYALKGWNKKNADERVNARMEKLSKWQDALKEWSEAYEFKENDDAGTRLERLKAFYDICRELGGEEATQ